MLKRTKTVTNNITSQGVEVLYKDNSDIYIKNEGNYHLVNSKGSVMDILKYKKKELNQYLKSNKISFNKNKEASITALAKYYDQVTN